MTKRVLSVFCALALLVSVFLVVGQGAVQAAEPEAEGVYYAFVEKGSKKETSLRTIGMGNLKLGDPTEQDIGNNYVKRTYPITNLTSDSLREGIAPSVGNADGSIFAYPVRKVKEGGKEKLRLVVCTVTPYWFEVDGAGWGNSFTLAYTNKGVPSEMTLNNNGGGEYYADFPDFLEDSNFAPDQNLDDWKFVSNQIVTFMFGVKKYLQSVDRGTADDDYDYLLELSDFQPIEVAIPKDLGAMQNWTLPVTVNGEERTIVYGTDPKPQLKDGYYVYQAGINSDVPDGADVKIVENSLLSGLSVLETQFKKSEWNTADNTLKLSPEGAVKSRFIDIQAIDLNKTQVTELTTSFVRDLQSVAGLKFELWDKEQTQKLKDSEEIHEGDQVVFRLHGLTPGDYTLKLNWEECSAEVKAQYQEPTKKTWAVHVDNTLHLTLDGNDPNGVKPDPTNDLSGTDGEAFKHHYKIMLSRKLVSEKKIVEKEGSGEKLSDWKLLEDGETVTFQIKVDIPASYAYDFTMFMDDEDEGTRTDYYAFKSEERHLELLDKLDDRLSFVPGSLKTEEVLDNLPDYDTDEERKAAEEKYKLGLQAEYVEADKSIVIRKSEIKPVPFHMDLMNIGGEYPLVNRHLIIRFQAKYSGKDIAKDLANTVVVNREEHKVRLYPPKSLTLHKTWVNGPARDAAKDAKKYVEEELSLIPIIVPKEAGTAETEQTPIEGEALWQLVKNQTPTDWTIEFVNLPGYVKGDLPNEPRTLRYKLVEKKNPDYVLAENPTTEEKPGLNWENHYVVPETKLDFQKIWVLPKDFRGTVSAEFTLVRTVKDITAPAEKIDLTAEPGKTFTLDTWSWKLAKLSSDNPPEFSEETVVPSYTYDDQTRTYHFLRLPARTPKGEEYIYTVEEKAGSVRVEGYSEKELKKLLEVGALEEVPATEDSPRLLKLTNTVKKKPGKPSKPTPSGSRPTLPTVPGESKPTKPSKPTEPKRDEVPKTGEKSDTASVALVLLLAAVAGAGLLLKELHVEKN